MSQENVERIRRAYEVLNRSGWESEEARRLGTELLHPDIEWHDQRELPGADGPPRARGCGGTPRRRQEALEYETMDVYEVLDADPCVLVVYRVHAHGRLSGVSVERDAVNVYRFRGAKVDRVDIFGTRREALEAAGLSE